MACQGPHRGFRMLSMEKDFRESTLPALFPSARVRAMMERGGSVQRFTLSAMEGNEWSL